MNCASIARSYHHPLLFLSASIPSSSSSLFNRQITTTHRHHNSNVRKTRYLTTATTMTLQSNDVTEKKKIVTHNGTFHCDEVLACYMLKNHVQTFIDSEIIRTRNPEIINGGDIVVDVGGVYDDEKKRYDHHQRGFEEVFNKDTEEYSKIKLSSAGLIYKHYGKEIIQSILNKFNIEYSIENDLHVLYNKIYKDFIESLDAIDNGIEQVEQKENCKKLYVSKTDLSSRISFCNPDWYEVNVDIDNNFQSAMLIAGNDFIECVKRITQSWLPARLIIQNAFIKRFEQHSSGNILVLSKFAPWKDHVYNLEKENDGTSQILYVIYQDSTNDSWRIQCVPVQSGSFVSRKPLPQAWRGLRDQQLSDVSGVEGCVFIHASGFIGGNKTFEGVMDLAKKALEQT